MLKNLVIDEINYIFPLMIKHWVAILACCLSTVIFIAMNSQGFIFINLGDRGLNSLVYYGVLPLLVGMLVFRMSPSQLGLGLGNYKLWVPLSVLFLAITIPLIYLSTIKFSSINAAYNRPNFEMQQYLLQTSLKMLGWEFILRGFLLFSLKKSLKEGAILLQMVPFTLLHFGLPEIVIYGCILPGLAYGYISYRGNSFWPAFLTHMVVNITVHLLAIGYFK